MRRLALIGGWFVVVVLATALTWQIVSAADDRVSERPASPLNVAAPQLGPSGAPTLTTPEVVTTPTTSTTTTSSTSTTIPGVTTTTLESTSTSKSSPTSATTVGDWMVKTTSTNGGTVVIKYRPDEVVLQAASPSAGFRADVEKAGPPDVKVEFESETLKIEFRARWDQGELDVEVSESADD